MRSWSLLCLALAALGISASPIAWKSGTVYKYHLTGRTLTSILEAQDSYAGIALQGQIELRLIKSNVLSAKILHLKYASLHMKLPGGWNSPIPENSLHFKTSPISYKPFEIKLKDGLIDGLVVSGDVPTWELNILKAVVSLLQIDTEGKDLVRDSYNSKPNHTASSPNAAYRKIEDSITGKCEVLYDIAPLPPYLALIQPHLAPLVKNIADTPLIEIVKTQNYSNCDKRIVFNFGFPGRSDFQHPAENQVGEFLARSSVSRVIISGSLRRYTIQSSVTTNKVILSPILYNKQKAMVVGTLNLTLSSLRSASGSSQLVTNPKEESSLAYTYENVFAYERDSSESALGDASYSSISKSSSEEIPNRSTSRSSEKVHRKSVEDSSSIYESNESSLRSDISRSRSLPSSEELSAGDRLKRSAYIDPERMSQTFSEELDGDSIISDSLSNENIYPKSYQSHSEESKDESGTWYSRESIEENKNYVPLPSLENAPSLPLLPLFTGLSGKSITHKINVVETVRKMAAHIARDISNENAMVKLNSLTKFAILTEVVRTMNVKQLKTATSNLYFSKPSSNAGDSESQAIRLNSWVAFRDAVSQAGTTPALMVIKDWILSSRVKGEEAAELIAVLPSSAITPTPDYLKEFFKLVTATEVKKQSILNETALLGFTDLIRLSQIDNATAHKYYPVHVFGRYYSKAQRAVQQEYIPYLEKSLKEAVSQNDNMKIHVYVRAIGNIAHPKILEIFEPYLENQKYVTTFQRTSMVVAMNQLAKLYPEVARNVLFKIYQNTAEAYELRSVAVFLLFSTNPPAAMLQRMAEFTNYEPNMQVKAAVITGILSHANLKSPEHREIVRAARSALNLLNTTISRMQYTSTNVRSYDSQSLALAYSQTLNFIGSQDSFIPKAMFYNVTRNVGGFKQSFFSLGGMVSSVDYLLEILKSHLRINEAVPESAERQSDKRWTASKLRDALNFKPSLIDPVEGNVMVKFAGISRFLPFDETSLEKLPAVAQDVMEYLGSERSFNFTKFYQFPVKLAFPLATGLPFVYSLKTPSVVSVGGKARVRAQPEVYSRSTNVFSMPKILNATGDLDVLWASKVEAEIGFFTTFDSTQYIAGIQKNSQINLPIRAKIDVDTQNVTIYLRAEPIIKDKPTTILHYSVEPFIVRHNILNLAPVQEEDDYEKIEEKHCEQKEKIFGEQSTGMAFSWSYGSSKKWSSKSKIFDDAIQDPWMLLYYPLAENQIKNENASFIFRPDRSTTSSVAVSLSYVNKENSFTSEKQEMDVDIDDMSHPRHKKSTRRSRQGYSETEAVFKIDPEYSRQHRMAGLLNQVDSIMKGKPALAVDFSAQFVGESKSAFIATAALARSPIDENAHMLLSAYVKPVAESEHPLHVFWNVSSKAPNVPLINFKDAQKANPLFSVNASLYFGDTSSERTVIDFQAKFNQSEDRQQYVSQHPLAQKCESQMSRGNNALPACRNVTAESNYMDQLEILLNYNNIPIAAKNISYKSYSYLRSFVFPYVDENLFEESYTPNHIRVVSKLSPDLTLLNVSVETPLGISKIEDLPLGPLSGPLLAVHPVYSAVERFSKAVLGDQFNAKCSIGASAVNTFDNNTYPVHLGNCWHALLVLAPKQNPKARHISHRYLPRVDEENDVAILVRDSDSLKKEVKIIAGKDVVDLTPSSLINEDEESRVSVSGRVRINERSFKIARENFTEIYNDKGHVWLQIYIMEPSSLKLKFPRHGLKMLYDGNTFQLSANDSFRDNTMGLCGTFDSQPMTDFSTSTGKYINITDLFVASYSIPDECQGPATTLRRKAWQKAVISVRPEYAGPNVINLADILGGISVSSSSSSHESIENSPENIRGPSDSKPTVKTLHVLHTTVFDEGSEVCFSVYPLPACSIGARPSSRIEKSIPVYCLPRKNPTAKKLKSMIDNGMNPDLRRKGATKYLKVSLPKSCVRN